jgi:hypothetical protein
MTASPINGAGKTGIYRQKNETGISPYTSYDLTYDPSHFQKPSLLTFNQKKISIVQTGINISLLNNDLLSTYYK